MYNLIGCVTKRHTHSVNVVQFSTSGEYLASGDDAGLLLVYKVEDVDEYDKYHFEAAITSVAWVPGRPQIIVGLANCEVHIVYVVSAIGRRAQHLCLYFQIGRKQGFRFRLSSG